jgi:RHS repeat-associated protein
LPALLPRTRTLLTTRRRWRNRVSVRRRASGRAHYNYFRDYDPTIGRYAESDPAGLSGGLDSYAYVGNSPVYRYDPLGLWWFGDPLPKWLVNGVAGFGDTVSFGITSHVRDAADIGDVNKCSTAYSAGQWTGFGYGLVAGGTGLLRGYQAGREFSFGRNFRIAPFGNRTGHPTGRFPHYHRRVVDKATGLTLPGQGIGRHRPWDSRFTDRKWWERF